MRKLVVGMLAHVDAGKTTLSEAMLYRGGAIKKLGRVDHQNAFLDTDEIERERGITIFSKQALLDLPSLGLTLLDTPGHVDFSTEMERTLQVLDCAILVVSGTDGVQGHTLTLWRLLRRYRVPTFLFINKMDLAGTNRDKLMDDLHRRLDEGCVDFSADDVSLRDESIAMCGEAALDEFLQTGTLADGTIADLIARRRVFPCFFGSALKLNGVDELLAGLEHFAPVAAYPQEFGARVFKISRDPQGSRLTWMKITGGELKAKTVLSGGEGDEAWQEKADQLRLYSGVRFTPVDSAAAGSVCAVTGLTHTRPGMGLGCESRQVLPILEPVLTYQLILPEGCDPHIALGKLSQLEEEDPQLHIVWNQLLRQIHIQLMGQVQLEVLRRVISERFGMDVEFGPGSIVYKETISDTVEGIGHFEPLRHYAEVHLLLEPGEAGSGLRFESACSTDALDLNWQRLVMTHLAEKEHVGVLTGSPITDMKISLIAGRAHNKHTEGGDFRQATYRAVRHGLMQARSVLLEPWYSFRLELPADNVGRAMTDIQTMGGSFDPPEPLGELTLLPGSAPVAGLRDYWKDVTAYTRGRGRLTCQVLGYRPCHDEQAVIAAIDYDALRDTANPADSVFCSHGAGFVVPWQEVAAHADVESSLKKERTPDNAPAPAGGSAGRYTGSLEQDKELQAIFERTYGKVEPKAFQPAKKPARTSLDDKQYTFTPRKTGPEYLLVDGYNIIFAWDELKELARHDVSAARSALTDLLINYQGARKCQVILVFDAYKVKGNPGSVEKTGGIFVVYTKEAETADAYIEKTTYDLSKNHRVRVATSDALEQLIILGHGALRISARSFREEMEQTQGQISRFLAEHNRLSSRTTQLKDTARIISKDES
ncbi:MAG: TetM/TetW/TetO/TetS family tetracycline resistance ribosomal protection protein [Oscillospiraceae bacterium]|nr:TetM/TetW/TetO/TetS family tetracycline resistance ribosomal protection protein [Oscillospiraceae bacterium]